MKRIFSLYFSIWSVLVIIFNVIAFVSPGWMGIEKYSASYWVGYAAIMVAFICQLCCVWKLFDGENLQKFFYNVPIVRISYTGLIATLIIGGLCMFLSLLWGWVAAILCVAVAAITSLALIKANTAAEIVSDIDEKIEEKTSFIKEYTLKSRNLCDLAKSDVAKVECEKIAEMIRYSDPVFNEKIQVENIKVQLAFDDFEEAIKEKSDEEIIFAFEKLEKLIKARNNACKLYK